ncbi:Proline dehydrogenase domain [Sesbania bispinosa]|nr:Proline dehydrogenase domain [Sesbania bispinosa]
MDRSKSHTDLLAAGRKKKRAEPLSPEEESDLELANQRLLELFQKCVQGNIPLLVDAEHTAVQPAIDYFTYSSAIMHNNGENPIVFGTIQTYLKDAKERLLLTTEAADKMGVPMGFKLVRGAYMSTERKLAAAKAHELGIGKVNHRLEFAQLYGMSDALSFSLSNAGFQVSKYMPFGPVEMVMPYLLRRAEENKGLLAASGFDRQLIRKELGRRLKAVF